MSLSKTIVKLVIFIMGTKRLAHLAVRSRKNELSALLQTKLNNIVQFGPFAGLKLPATNFWGDGDRGAILTGLYESNLHQSIVRAIARKPEIVVNVGCADGYYSNGFALVLPEAHILAVDIDPSAGQVCMEMARLNGHDNRITFKLGSSYDFLLNATNNKSGLLFFDCEGAEIEILDEKTINILNDFDVIIETHEYNGEDTINELKKRFSSSHNLEILTQGGRDPHENPVMSEWSELDRLIIAHEGRGKPMTWLLCWSKSKSFHD